MTGLVTCPDCARIGKKQVLGNILPGGQFLVLRFHHGTTIVESTQYKIVCGCGFYLQVSQGTVVTQ